MFIDTGWSSLPKFGEELCGDNVEIVKTVDAVVAVLADGLGSGVKANILSKMTAKIIATMLEKGAALEEVVETVGNTLPVCQKRLLAYSTFTIVRVRENGETYVVEFDNPPTFYIHGGRVANLSFREKEIFGKRIKETSFTAAPGDILVVVSDGIIHAGIGGVLNLGWQWGNVAEYLQRMVKPVISAQGFSQWLLAVCKQLYAERPGDDATVMTLQLRNPRTVSLAVGPPSSKADDERLI
ncbi:MAG: SpoIIE family protein phosphatase, partial [Bacillota bacterium]